MRTRLFRSATCRPNPADHRAGRAATVVVASLVGLTASFVGLGPALGAPAGSRPAGEATSASRDASLERPAGGAEFAADRLRPGRLVAAIVDLDEPAAVLVGNDGRVFVAEAAGGRVRVYAAPEIPDPLPAAPTVGEILDPERIVVPPPTLALEAILGRPLDRREDAAADVRRVTAPLERPVALAAFGGRGILIGDAAARTVWLLSPNGAVERITDWDGFPDPARQFNGPHGLAAKGDRIAVTESVTGRVMVLTVADDRIAATSIIDPDPPLRRPVAVDFTASGELLVADADAVSIRRFAVDDAGAWIESGRFGDYGPFPGFYEEPSDVDAVGDGALVTDVRTHRLQWHGGDGTFVEAWGIHARRPHEAGGVIHYPADVDLDPAGRFVALAEPREMRVQIFAGNPRSFDPAEPIVPLTTPRDAHFGPRIDLGRELLVLAEPDAHRVHLFDVRREVPIIVGSFGERGAGNGLLLRTTGLLLDERAGIIDLVDAAKTRLQRLRLNWEPGEPTGFKPGRFRFARFVPFESIAAGRAGAGGVAVPGLGFGGPVTVRPGPDGRRLIVDPLGDRIIVLDDQLRPVTTEGGAPMVWGGRGTEPGQLRRPTDAAVSPNGQRVYVVDADNHRVQIFRASDGQAIATFGTRGTGDGAFLDPFGVAVGPDGRVHVTDRGAHVVQTFDADGGFLARFGGRGADHEQLWRPGGIAVHADGRIFVVDVGNHRAKIFDPDGAWRVTFGTGRAFTRERRDAGSQRRPPRRAGDRP